MKEGEQYRLGDLYYSLMLESHNDTAVAIAETVGGSVEGFADLMNQKAEELGLKSTYYITPNGLDASDDSGTHSTSAYDLARVLRYCILESTKREEFLEITGTREKSFSNLEGDRIFHVYNKNKYLDMNPDAISGKTGFTCDAGYCYVGAVENEGRTFIVALLGCGWPNNKDYKWSDMNKLISYGEEYYTKQTVITPEYETGSIPVERGIEAEQVSTYTEAELTLLLSDADSIEITLELPEVLLAPVQAKEKVGQLSVTLNGYPYASYPVYAGETIGRKDFMYWLQYTLVQYLF
jgi:D-alanyl-D-alanine carboxypeptidase (penicillin-binding protein 5/6)